MSSDAAVISGNSEGTEPEGSIYKEESEKPSTTCTNSPSVQVSTEKEGDKSPVSTHSADNQSNSNDSSTTKGQTVAVKPEKSSTMPDSESPTDSSMGEGAVSGDIDMSVSPVHQRQGKSVS